MRERVRFGCLLWIVFIGLMTMTAVAHGESHRTFHDLIEGEPLDNLLVNPAFQSESYWVLKGDATMATGVGRGGTRGVIQRSSFEYESELLQTIGARLIPGRWYTAMAWVRATSADSIAVLGVRWDGGHPRVYRGVSPVDGWVKIEFRFVAPQQEGWRQIVLSGAGSLVWDEVVLFEAESLEERLASGWSQRLAAGDEIYTGLVVNAKGTDLQRGMNPMIYDEAGQLVFAGIGAGDGQMFTEGIVAYATELDVGVSHPRLEVNSAFPLRVPLVVDAQDTRGFPRTAVVVGNEDANRIRRAVQNYDFLGRFAIVFVVEPFAGF